MHVKSENVFREYYLAKYYYEKMSIQSFSVFLSSDKFELPLITLLVPTDHF